MRATELLKQEHRVIEQVLNCLEAIAKNAKEQNQLKADSAFSAIEFFKLFADRCHHAKEEGRLFPAMEASGFDRNAGPTGVMVHEHQQGRQLVQNMEKSVANAANGDLDALKIFISSAGQYIDLLREHIQKEDHCLYPMADEALGEASIEELALSSEFTADPEINEESHRSMIELANSLAIQYNVAIADSSQLPACGCGNSHHV